MNYDLYLYTGCRSVPDLEDLLPEIPALTDPDLRTRILRYQPSPGFLELDLSKTVAQRLLQRLKAVRATGYYLPSAYRQPRVTMQQALPLAEQAIAELQARYVPNDHLGPIHLVQEKPVCWTFGAVSPQLVNEDRIPGILHASIDKLDCHIWTIEEFDRLWGE